VPPSTPNPPAATCRARSARRPVARLTGPASAGGGRGIGRCRDLSTGRSGEPGIGDCALAGHAAGEPPADRHDRGGSQREVAHDKAARQFRGGRQRDPDREQHTGEHLSQPARVRRGARNRRDRLALGREPLAHRDRLTLNYDRLASLRRGWLASGRN
jgi:hypothetical protein